MRLRQFAVWLFFICAALAFGPSMVVGQTSVKRSGPVGKKVRIQGTRSGPSSSSIARGNSSTGISRANYSARYIMSENSRLGFSVLLTADTPSNSQKWVGTLVMKTEKATPSLPDGRAMGFGTVSSAGHLKSFIKSGGKWIRHEQDDIFVPESMNFSNSKLTGHKITKGLEKLPHQAHTELKIMEAIFPEVSVLAKNDKKELGQSYLKLGAGRIQNAKGKGTLSTNASGNQSNRLKEFVIRDESGKQLRDITLKQTATFDSGSRSLRSATTFLMVTETYPAIIKCETKQIGFAKALEMMK